MKRKKRYYVPGLISLIGLPILLAFYNPGNIARPCALKIYLVSDEKDSPGVKMFNTAYLYRTIRHKKIVSVDLDENRPEGDPEIENFLLNRKFAFIVREMEKLKFEHDTSRILKIQLGENCSFGDFAWILDKTLLYRVRRFAFADNAFFLLAEPPQERDFHMTTTDSPIINAPPYTPPSKWDVFLWDADRWWQQAAYIIKNNLLYLAGFFVLIFIPGILVTYRNLCKKAINRSPAD